MSPPLLADDPDTQAHVSVYWEDSTRVLNPLEPVTRRPPLPSSEKRVHFVASSPSSPETQPIQVQPATPPAATSTPPTSPGAKHILLVEDNLVNQKLGVRLLQKMSYRCDVAENGQIALDMVTTNRDKYGLALMDCQMPVMNGFECTRRIRAFEKQMSSSSRLPIIALTANVSSESRTECQEAGADHFLPKPLLLRDLKSAIQQYFPNGDPLV